MCVFYLSYALCSLFLMRVVSFNTGKLTYRLLRCVIAHNIFHTSIFLWLIEVT